MAIIVVVGTRQVAAASLREHLVLLYTVFARTQTIPSKYDLTVFFGIRRRHRKRITIWMMGDVTAAKPS